LEIATLPHDVDDDDVEDGTSENLETDVVFDLDSVDRRRGGRRQEAGDDDDDGNDDDDDDRFSTSSTMKKSSSMVEFESKLISSSTRMYNQDSARARSLGIDVPVYQLITMKVEEFALALKRASPAQACLMRDIRKRGKNKVAAMNCRRRKMKKLDSIQDKVAALVAVKDQLLEEEDGLTTELDEWRRRYSQLYSDVFDSLLDTETIGDKDQFVMHHADDGSLQIIITDDVEIEDHWI